MTLPLGIGQHATRATDLFWVPPEQHRLIGLHHWQFDTSYHAISHTVTHSDDPEQSISTVFAGRSGAVPQEIACRTFIPFPDGFYAWLRGSERSRPRLWP
jgi:hypothetical protein